MTYSVFGGTLNLARSNYQLRNCTLLCAETVMYHRGDTVRLPCNTSRRNYVQWNYGLRLEGKGVGVYENGQIDESYARFSVEYPLIIRNATAEDEGYYACVENAGSGSEIVRYRLQYEGTVVRC